MSVSAVLIVIPTSSWIVGHTVFIQLFVAEKILESLHRHARLQCQIITAVSPHLRVLPANSQDQTIDVPSCSYHFQRSKKGTGPKSDLYIQGFASFLSNFDFPQQLRYSKFFRSYMTSKNYAADSSK